MSRSSWFCCQGRSREKARSLVAADWGKVPRSQSPSSRNHSLDEENAKKKNCSCSPLGCSIVDSGKWIELKAKEK